MERPWRIQYEGALYHILFRGNDRGEIVVDDRDLLIHLIWQTGALTNQEIGRYFGLSYLPVSRRAHIVESRLQQDEKFREKYDTVNFGQRYETMAKGGFCGRRTNG
jgi:hypothetical protein